MLETNGIPPKLAGRECEELICQQYWQEGKLAKAVDVLYIKSHDHWYQLYFEGSTLFWRSQQEGPIPYQTQENDPFQYPQVDLTSKYHLKGKIITDCEALPMVNGVKVVLQFEKGDKVIVASIDDETSIQHIKAG
ncbi:hypothetical protein [Kaarinaea lacus]